MPKTLPLLIFALSLGLPLAAQVDRASLNGTITDPSGAVVSGASIDVYFAGTGFKRAVLSTNIGTYVIPALPIGHCRITVQARGFQSQQVDDLVLTVGEARTLDFALAFPFPRTRFK
jgi:hypothetical protein